MKPYWSYGDRIKPVELTRGMDFMCGCIYGLVRSHTVSHGLVDRYQVFKSFKLESYTAFMDTLEWPECNSDKATVGTKNVRLYVRFTRMANRISRVFCVNLKENIIKKILRRKNNERGCNYKY